MMILQSQDTIASSLQKQFCYCDKKLCSGCESQVTKQIMSTQCFGVMTMECTGQKVSHWKHMFHIYCDIYPHVEIVMISQDVSTGVKETL